MSLKKELKKYGIKVESVKLSGSETNVVEEFAALKKAYKFYFDGVLEESLGSDELSPIFYISSKKDVSLGDDEGKVIIEFPIKRLRKFFNRFNLDEGYIEDKLRLYALNEDGSVSYWLLSEEDYEDFIDEEDEDDDDSDEDDDSDDDSDDDDDLDDDEDDFDDEEEDLDSEDDDEFDRPY